MPTIHPPCSYASGIAVCASIASPADDDFVGSLERLAALHRDGLLDDIEYAQAKQRLLPRE